MRVARSRAEIEAAKRELTEQHGPTYAPILDVYLLMHGDALLIDAISQAIEEERINADWAVSQVAERLKKPLLQDSSSYFHDPLSHVLSVSIGGYCVLPVRVKDRGPPYV